jgi:hypothetical protein
MGVLPLFDSLFAQLGILSTSILVLEGVTVKTHTTIDRLVRTADNALVHAVDIMNSPRGFDLFSMRFVIIMTDRTVQHILIQMSSIRLTFGHMSSLVVGRGSRLILILKSSNI